MRACGNTILVIVDETRKDTTCGGIVLPETTCSDLFRGTVHSVGLGKTKSEVIPCQEGDKIVFRDFEQITLKEGTLNLLVIQFCDVICIEGE